MRLETINKATTRYLDPKKVAGYVSADGYKTLFDEYLDLVGSITVTDPPGDIKIKEKDLWKSKDIPADSDECCSICLSELKDEPCVELLSCPHVYHLDCIRHCIKNESSLKCPLCSKITGIVIGNQPPATMSVALNVNENLEGDPPNTGYFIVNYVVKPGSQNDTHPNPGLPYCGTRRTAFFPDTPEGRHVLRLIKLAFRRKLIFTVGTSTSSGKSDQTIWNGIHHKTHSGGGAARHGYPDPTYLARVTEELAALGVLSSDVDKSRKDKKKKSSKKKGGDVDMGDSSKSSSHTMKKVSQKISFFKGKKSPTTLGVPLNQPSALTVCQDDDDDDNNVLFDLRNSQSSSVPQQAPIQPQGPQPPQKMVISVPPSSAQNLTGFGQQSNPLGFCQPPPQLFIPPPATAQGVSGFGQPPPLQQPGASPGFVDNTQQSDFSVPPPSQSFVMVNVDDLEKFAPNCSQNSPWGDEFCFARSRSPSPLSYLLDDADMDWIVDQQSRQQQNQVGKNNAQDVGNFQQQGNVNMGNIPRNQGNVNMGNAPQNQGNGNMNSFPQQQQQQGSMNPFSQNQGNNLGFTPQQRNMGNAPQNQGNGNMNSFPQQQQLQQQRNMNMGNPPQNQGNGNMNPFSQQQQGNTNMGNAPQNQGNGNMNLFSQNQGNMNMSNAPQNQGNGNMNPFHQQQQGNTNMGNAPQNQGNGNMNSFPQQQQGNTNMSNAPQNQGNGNMNPFSQQQQGNMNMGNAPQNQGNGNMNSFHQQQQGNMNPFSKNQGNTNMGNTPQSQGNGNMNSFPQQQGNNFASQNQGGNIGFPQQQGNNFNFQNQRNNAGFPQQQQQQWNGNVNNPSQPQPQVISFPHGNGGNFPQQGGVSQFEESGPLLQTPLNMGGGTYFNSGPMFK